MSDTNAPPLPPESEPAARFHAYNDWLKGEERATVAEAFAAGWRAGGEYERSREASGEQQ